MHRRIGGVEFAGIVENDLEHALCRPGEFQLGVAGITVGHGVSFADISELTRSSFATLCARAPQDEVHFSGSPAPRPEERCAAALLEGRARQPPCLTARTRARPALRLRPCWRTSPIPRRDRPP